MELGRDVVSWDESGGERQERKSGQTWSDLRPVERSARHISATQTVCAAAARDGRLVGCEKGGVIGRGTFGRVKE